MADYLFVHAQSGRLISSDRSTKPPLPSFRHRGRLEKKAGTRELVLSPVPWTVVYAVARSTSFASYIERNEDPERLQSNNEGLLLSGQWRARRDGIPGMYGNVGIVESVTYRI